MVQTPLPEIDYTARDFESIKESLVEYLKRRFPDDFTDFNESQLGIALLEMVAYSYSIMSFMLDRTANEVYIDTARQRRNVIKIAGLLGYKLAGATSANISAILLDGDTLSTYSGPVFIAQGTQMVSGGLTFETNQDYTIQRTGSAPNFMFTINGGQPVPSSLVTIAAIEGETVTDNFTATEGKFQNYTLSRAPLIDGSLSTSVALVAWTLVESIILGDPSNPDNTQIYETLVDERDRATLRFGDGTAGDIPASGSTITVTYRVGGGSAGNIAVGAIDQSISALHNGSESITVGARNISSGSGGTDRESLDRARLFAPQFAKTTDRAVTYNDYFTLCNGYTDGVTGTIAKAGIIADPTDGISNAVTVYTWTEDAAGDLQPTLETSPINVSLRNFLNDRRTLSVYISPVQGGENVSIDLDILLRVDPAFADGEILTTVRNSLEDLFRESRVRFGNDLRLSWVYDTVQAVRGVNWVHVKQFGSIIDPVVVEGVTEEIEDDLLPTQTGSSGPTVLQIVTPIPRVADFYCNYRLIMNGEKRRIVASTASSLPSLVSTVTVDTGYTTTPTIGDPFTITHPRRARLDSNASDVNDYYNNRCFVIDTQQAGTLKQERIILDYEVTDFGGGEFQRVIFMNQDWNTNPAANDPYRITPDVKVIDSQAIVAGTINLTSII